MSRKVLIIVDKSTTTIQMTTKGGNNGFLETNIVPIWGDVIDYDIDWGDGTTEHVTTADKTHDYANANETYNITITGDIEKYGHNTNDIWTQSGGINSRYLFTSIIFSKQKPKIFSLSQHQFLTSLDMEKVDVSLVTDMSWTFYNLSITDLSTEINNITTSQVTNMTGMFGDNNNITSLIFPSSFNTSQVTNMSYMFYNCDNLTNINISNFNTSQVTNMEYMFGYLRALTSLNISNFTTTQVTNMKNMFDSFNSDDGTASGILYADNFDSRNAPTDVVANTSLFESAFFGQPTNTEQETLYHGGLYSYP